ncbi:MAG: orotidine-5'-phosphate decarboxylase [Pseudomonadales bacterium]|nr:orotidine-5'-phosphate decarboxylase [Pseudomonadales bacterium]MCP5184910.1 orotidine-5'-phosphate decarboxylase [Pseudomonadales bacterium]
MSSPIPFSDRLRASWRAMSSLVCVGLDPIPERLPAGFSPDAEGCLAFCKAIVDATAPHVAAFKPQAAHFAAVAGENALATLIDYIHVRHPRHVVLLDAKRGDIDSTAERYAIEAFVRYGADAVTVSPFLGDDCIRPYLDHPGKGVIVLCRTSNSSGDWLQLQPEQDPIYLQIARRALTWNEHGDIGLVVGATYPQEMQRVRDLVGDMPILVPGVGAQGGRIDAVVAAGADSRQEGLLISASRSILFASAEADFAQAAAREAERMKTEIALARQGLNQGGALR